MTYNRQSLITNINSNNDVCAHLNRMVNQAELWGPERSKPNDSAKWAEFWCDIYTAAYEVLTDEFRTRDSE